MKMKPFEAFKGQITVFLSLLFSILLGLLFTVLYSSLHSGKRTMAESTADIAVHSLFAEYNAKLLKDYDLFYLDLQELNRGLGKEGLALECETMSVEQLKNPRELTALLGYSDMLRIQAPEIRCKRYSLATDCDGEVFRQQVIHYMKATYPETLLNLLQEKVKDPSVSEENRTGKRTGKLPPAEVELGDINPDVLGYVNLVKAGGILTYTWGKPLSVNYLDSAQCVGKRANRLQGEGFYKRFPDNGATDKLLFNEYLLNHFGNALEKKDNRRLNYEIEYIISGKDSDTENLKSVAYRILAIREAANYLHILSDPVKMSQAEGLAAAVSTVLLMPEGVEMFQKLIVGAWAFGESMLDLRELFDNKEIPLIKNAADFKLEITNITDIFRQDYQSSSSVPALDYKGYLRLLLLVGADRTLSFRSMDLIEVNMRKDENYKEFRMDACVEWAEFEMKFDIDREIVYTKQFGYIQ